MRLLTDARLQAKTRSLGDLLEEGDSDDILVEASRRSRGPWRILRMRPSTFRSWAARLHQGKIVEMKTGEGKTLVATMPSTVR